jgi:hypothetical protein
LALPALAVGHRVSILGGAGMAAPASLYLFSLRQPASFPAK